MSRAAIRPSQIALAACVVLAVAGRSYASSPLWLDEALSVHIAQLPLSEMVDALRADGNPPLYYALLHGWMQIFGDGDVAVRSLSGVLSVATIPLVWMAADRLAGRAAATWSVVLVGLSPFAVRYATEARPYALVMFLVVAGQLLLRRAIDAPGMGRLLPVAVVSGALMLSHYWGVWLVLAAVGVLVIAGRRGHPASRRVAVAAGAGAVLFVPWAPVALDQIAETGTPWGEVVRPTAAIATAILELGGDFSESGVLGAVIVVLAVLGALARRTGTSSLLVDPARRSRVTAELCVAGVAVGLGAVAATLGGATFASRYASVAVPLVLLAAAVGASELPRSLALPVLALVVLVGIAGLALNVRESRTQADQVAAAIERAARPGDVVAYCPDQRGPAVSRLLDAPVEQVTFPDLDPPDLVDWRNYDERITAVSPESFVGELEDLAARDGAIWLVSSGSYAHGPICADVAAVLASSGRPGEQIVTEEPDLLEPIGLTRFG
jgi:mannosyltransferase